MSSQLAEYKENLKLEIENNKRKSAEREARKQWETLMKSYGESEKSDFIIQELTKLSGTTVSNMVDSVKSLQTFNEDFLKDCFYFIEGALHKTEAYKGDSKTKLKKWIETTFSLLPLSVRNEIDDTVTEISIDKQVKQIDNSIRYLAEKGRGLLGIDKPEKKKNDKTKGDNAKKYIEKNLAELTDPERVDIARQLLNSLSDDNFASVIIIEKLKNSATVYEEVRDYMRGAFQVETWEKECLRLEISKETSITRMKVEAVIMDHKFFPAPVKTTKKEKSKK